MTPVRLQLHNFLSYGEEAPALDFEELHVACLSGGNGQGKSALLEAMTWAVWGEARKSSDARKPDEELLRIGSRSMSVTFDFRSAGVEYRIVRSYQQSASGKTSKPGLEVQVRDGDDWRPITASSVRETQAVIDERVGVDYETFINSTFLLQGRSDEFTKKKPGERKEILGKILALGRYEAMAAKAGARWSALREQAKTLEAESERLAAALEPVASWEQERNVASATVETLRADVEVATKAEAEAAARLAELDAVAREADSATAALAQLGQRNARLLEETATVKARLREADALIAQSDQIEADHERYENLRQQRNALDEKATLFRGIESQRHAATLELERKKAEAQREIDALSASLDRLHRQIEQDERAVASADEIRASYATARSAAETLVALDNARQQRDTWTGRIDAIDKRLASEKGQLDGKLAQLTEEGTRLAAELAAESPDLAPLRERVSAGDAARERREVLQSEGAAAAAGVSTTEEQLRRLTADRERIESRRQRLASSEDEVCPTCGTDLTDAHREEVLATFQRDLTALAADEAALRSRHAAAVRQRDLLREEYKQLAEPIQAADAAARELSRHEERARRREETAARVEALREEVRAMKKALREESYLPGLRSERTELTDQLASDPYDPTVHETARRDAGLLDHWTGQLRAVEVATERLIEARADRDRRSATLDERRQHLDSGAPFAEIQARLARLDEQVETIGYDAQAHERVGRDLDALSDAPKRLSSLLEARRQRAELTERATQLAKDINTVEADMAVLRTRIDGLQTAVAARSDAEAARSAAASHRSEVAQRLSTAEGHLGALRERLDRAETDRQRRREVRAELKEVKSQRALYGHLRRAFGKNGIPSLIIEETLPEIEGRANDLLDRLSGGRTRVALETLKDKKTGGGTRETLDIRITDAQGVARAYETYSGGEAFRVNFALRIALSQMLAERSGTQIRTLVIDEGFGTQDKEGLQSLVGAIRAIQDDFETILVITHLDEIKDAFPTRIEVRKEPVTGSTFEVIGL